MKVKTDTITHIKESLIGIILSIKVSSLILSISLNEIKGTMSKFMIMKKFKHTGIHNTILSKCILKTRGPLSPSRTNTPSNPSLLIARQLIESVCNKWPEDNRQTFF